MKDYEFEAVEYDGDAYCTEHLPDGLDGDSEGVVPIFAGEEVETAPVCCVCGYEHTYMNIIGGN